MRVPCAYYFGEKGRYGCVAGDSCKFSHDAADNRNPPARKVVKPQPMVSMTSLAPKPSVGPPPPQVPVHASSGGGPGSIPVKCQRHFNGGSCMLGVACPFLHSDDPKEEESRRALFQAKVSTSFPPSAPTLTPLPTPTPTEEVEWEFGDTSEPYFYGAPGTKIGTAANPPAAAPSSSIPQHTSSGPPCTFFLRGNCRKGATCRFSHTTSARNPAPHSAPLLPRPPPASESLSCSICLDDSSSDKFGILQNCFHVFHYSCLKNWRSEGSASVSTVRSCPVCRAPSHFIIPYATPVTDETKKRNLIAAYKLNCSKKDCNAFKEKGECPFGSSCFFRHVDFLGNVVVPPKPRIKLTDEGVVEGISQIKISSFLE